MANPIENPVTLLATPPPVEAEEAPAAVEARPERVSMIHTADQLKELLHSVEDQRLRQALTPEFYQNFGRSLGTLRSPAEASGSRATLYNALFDSLVAESHQQIQTQLLEALKSGALPEALRQQAEQLRAAELARWQERASGGNEPGKLELNDLASLLEDDPEFGSLARVVLPCLLPEGQLDQADYTQKLGQYLAQGAEGVLLAEQLPQAADAPDPREAFAEQVKLAASLLATRKDVSMSEYEEIMAQALAEANPEKFTDLPNQIQKSVASRPDKKVVISGSTAEQLRKLDTSDNPKADLLAKLITESGVGSLKYSNQGKREVLETFAFDQLKSQEEIYGNKVDSWFTGKDTISDVLWGAGTGVLALVAIPGLIKIASDSGEKGVLNKLKFLVTNPSIWLKIGGPIALTSYHFWGPDKVSNLVSPDFYQAKAEKLFWGSSIEQSLKKIKASNGPLETTTRRVLSDLPREQFLQAGSRLELMLDSHAARGEYGLSSAEVRSLLPPDSTFVPEFTADSALGQKLFQILSDCTQKRVDPHPYLT